MACLTYYLLQDVKELLGRFLWLRKVACHHPIGSLYFQSKVTCYDYLLYVHCSVQYKSVLSILLMLFQPDFVEEDLFIVIVRHFHFEEYCVVSRNHHVHTNLASHSLSVYTSTTLSVTYGFLLVKIFTRRTLRPATRTVQYMLKCMQVIWINGETNISESSYLRYICS